LYAAVEGLSRELSEQTMLAKVPNEEIGGNQDGGQCVFPLKSAMGQVEVEMRYPVGFRRRGEVMSETEGNNSPSTLAIIGLCDHARHIEIAIGMKNRWER
jgi:hypothetical protein